ncbi:MAG: hypothetical protein ACLTYW_02470 [Collinsella sp.]
MVSIYIDGMDSEELIIKLDAAGFEVSAVPAARAAAWTRAMFSAPWALARAGIGRLRIV